MIKICSICGKAFETNNAAKCICSAECFAEKARRRMRRYREQRKTQSNADKPVVQKCSRSKLAKCAVCGREFAPKYRGQKYCSAGCHSDPLAKSLRRFFSLIYDHFNLDASDLSRVERYGGS